jgi:hypothetical protein
MSLKMVPISSLAVEDQLIAASKEKGMVRYRCGMRAETGLQEVTDFHL